MERDPSLHELLMRRGRVKAIADALGIRTQAVSQWRRVPAEHAIVIADKLGIPLHELRPDLWPSPSAP